MLVGPLQFDAGGSSPKTKNLTFLLQPEELEAAGQLLDAEVSRVNKQLGLPTGVDEQYIEAWQNALNEMIYLPSQKRYGRIASATNSDKIESLQVSSDQGAEFALHLCFVRLHRGDCHTVLLLHSSQQKAVFIIEHSSPIGKI